jgi:hypothetical protein
LSLVKIHIINNEPTISMAPTLVGGQRVFTIVFSSNAPTPGNFDGTEGTLAADGNTELWIYRVPAVSDVNLTLGTDLPFQDLAGGTFTQITNTPASRVPSAGSTSVAPFIADDNREAAISDDGLTIAFISTRDLIPGGNNECPRPVPTPTPSPLPSPVPGGNPELFVYNVVTGAFIQGTNTRDAICGISDSFQANPSISANGSVVSFYSTSNIPSGGLNSDGNGEVYVAAFNGSAVSNIRQVTKTKTGANFLNANLLSPGRRLSRDGALIAFESRAVDPKANDASTNSPFYGTFVYTIASDTFTLIGARSPDTVDVNHFPAFTDYNPGTLAPSSLVFSSFLNFRTDGTFPAAAQDSEGLNVQRSPQLFLTQLPASSSNTFIRLTKTPPVPFIGQTRALTSDTRVRMAFSMGNVELGGGNVDGSLELFYLLSPIVTDPSAAVLTFNTGASNMAVATATPVPSPTPSPTPTPSPAPGTALGLAPGELSILRSTVSLAPGTAAVTTGASEKRSPALPVELNGVSVSINGGAAGLYFVGDTEKQINYITPIGTSTGVAVVAVNILNAGAGTDTLIRGLTNIIPAQPDIFSTTGDAGGSAIAVNVTNPNLRLPPPFNVTSSDGSNTVPTVIELSLTGVRLALKTELSITVGTTAITGDAIVLKDSNPQMPGFDIINFTLPASLAGAGDVPIVVTFTRVTGATTTSRSDTTASIIHIN